MPARPAIMTDQYEATGPPRGRHPVERRRRRRRRTWRAAKVVFVAALGAAIALAVVWSTTRSHGGGRTLTGPATSTSRGGAGGFHVTYPKNWKQVKSPPSPASAGPVVGALRRQGGKGLVIFHRAGRAGKFDQKFVQGVNDRLRRTIPDYRLGRSQILHLHDTDALYFAYYRVKKGTLTTITVVPAGDHAWVIDTVSPASSTRIAQEIGEIIRSLRLT